MTQPVMLAMHNLDRKALIPDTIQGVISAMCFKTVQITAEEQGGKMNNRRDNR